MLSPHQRAILVPGLFGNDTAPESAAARDLQDRRMTAKFSGYWAWAQTDKRVFGLNPYHWGKEAHLSEYGQGAGYYPNLVKRMKEVGAIIRGGSHRRE